MFLFGKKNKKGKDKDREKTDEIIKEEVKSTEVIDEPDEPDDSFQTAKASNASLSEADIQKNAAPELKEQKPERKGGLFSRLREGLSKTRNTLFAGLFSGNDDKLDDDFFDELEEAMIIADMGFETTNLILDKLRQELKASKIKNRTDAKEAIIRILADVMRPDSTFLEGNETPSAVLLIVGVNGVGKTTSIGKLASYYSDLGRKPIMAAADTFRAAAAEQLTIWAERTRTPIVKHGEGADPAAVVFDAIASYKAKGLDMLICDTAGRLHNKKNLMNELSKIRRVIDRELPGTPCEVLLVLDATTGQNAIAQAKAFGESAGLTGIIITKLDGTAKGGVAVAVKHELGLPVRFVGVGEGVGDLQPFDADEFARALI